MKNPDVEAQRQGQKQETADNAFRSTLTIGSHKSEAENDSFQSDGPGNFLRVVRHFVRLVLFVVVLGCLVLSKLSFVALAQRFNETMPTSVKQTDSMFQVKKAANFWRLLIALMIPNLFSFARCIWCGLISRTRRNYPWPSKPAILAGLLTSIGESIAICVFAFIVATRIPNSAITVILMCGVFSGTILDQLRRSRSVKQGRNKAQFHTAFEYEQYRVPRNYCRRRRRYTGSDDLPQNESTEGMNSGWKLIRHKLRVLVKHKRFRSTATWIALFLQIGSIIGLLVVLVTFVSDYWRILTAIPIALVVLSIVWCSPVQEYLNTPQRIPADDRPMASARWKNGILTGLWRVLSLPTVAIIMASMQYLGLNVDISYLGQGLKQLNDISEDDFFLVNIFSSWGAYVGAWLACTLMMDIVGFVIPLLLATPVAVIVIVVICRHDSTGALACGYDPNGPFDAHGIIPTCLGLLWISQIICCSLFYVYRTRLIPLIKEEKLFIQSYYNSPFTEQSLMLNRRTEFDDERLVDPRDVARNSSVFICTTMYREQLHEQRQLLESIHGIACEQAKNKTRNFESHIFFDGGAKGRHTTEFANQLFSLLYETLKIDLEKGQKWETPYGLQLRWNLAGDMPFYVHLKDPNKVKKKKRWSQVMYMSYVLDYRCPRTNYDDDNTFILTTDADIVFSREAVEILIDLLGRDRQVGAVCGRVHPLGSGPVVWYQIFDYAIGHWFQKVAEHVLGSVMCCPGCFSVFRARALRDVLPTYATKVDKAKDFLTKDMGEDRWLCMLMVQAGWRLEYSAVADSYTYCPDSFDEFFKQRRRWMPSTMANLTELCTSARQVIANNDAVSILFIVYQAAMVFSTIIAPGTVILVMAAGTTYAFDTSQDYDSNGTYITFLVIYIATAVGYGTVCIWCNQSTQLQTAKVLTFIFAIVMAAVSVGVAVQIAQGAGDDQPTPSANPSNTSLPAHHSHSVSLRDIAVSTWYLAGLASIFVVAAMLHPTEFFCLFHAIWYLLCLPSGYLYLIIYSICNLNDRSWGTRETAKQNTESQSVWQIFKSVFDKVGDVCSCCGCCRRPEPLSAPPTPSSTDSRTTDANTDSEQLSPPPHASDHPSPGEVQQSTLSPQAYHEPHASPVAGEIGANAHQPAGVNNSLPIKYFLDRVGLTDESNVQKFKEAGYDDTSFFIKMKPKDIESLGVKSTGFVQRIMKAINELPDTTVPRAVPANVAAWLESLGLSEYREKFARAGYEGKDGVASLVSVDSKVLRQEIGVSKPGHLKKLEMSVRMIKYPTDREVAILRAKATISDLPHRILGDDDDDERNFENAFWTELKKVGLEPDSEEYNEVETLKENLRELRNQTVLVFVVTNTIWIILITLLAQHANLTVLNTNALGLGFLVIYGLIVCLQFLTLIWHRLITIIHYLAHRVHDSTDIIPIGFEEYDVDLLDDYNEAKNYFPREMPGDSDDKSLSDFQQQNKRLRQSFQRLLSNSSMPRERSQSLRVSPPETRHLLSSSSRRNTRATFKGPLHSQREEYEEL